MYRYFQTVAGVVCGTVIGLSALASDGAKADDISQKHAAFDQFVSQKIRGCASGARDYSKIYHIIVDASASIDEAEWKMMMDGLRGGVWVLQMH